MMKNKKILIPIILGVLLFAILAAVNISACWSACWKSVGGNFAKNYPALAAEDALFASLRLTPAQAIRSGLTSAFLQILPVILLYFHICATVFLIRCGTVKMKRFTVCINIAMGIAGILLLLVYLWGTTISGGFDALGTAILYVWLFELIVALLGTFALINIIVFCIYKHKRYKLLSENPAR